MNSFLTNSTSIIKRLPFFRSSGARPIFYIEVSFEITRTNNSNCRDRVLYKILEFKPTSYRLIVNKSKKEKTKACSNVVMITALMHNHTSSRTYRLTAGCENPASSSRISSQLASFTGELTMKRLNANKSPWQNGK